MILVVLLEVTYQIGHFIHELIESDNKVKIFFEGYFLGGPNPRSSQTSSGLLLEEYYGRPSKIHTPCRSWHVLESGVGDFRMIVEKLKNPLGLELFKERV